LIPVAPVSADQELKSLNPLDHGYNDRASSTLQPFLAIFTMGLSASDKTPAAPDPGTFVTSHSEMQLV